MSPRASYVIDGQEPLFVGDLSPSATGSVRTWQEMGGSPSLRAYHEAKADGVPMVDVLERAIRIKEALNEMSAMSSVGVGFLTAVDTASGASIWGRYRRATPKVEQNARNKLPRREQRVKDLLGPATGYAALRASNPPLMDRLELDKRARHTWQRFTSRFTGPDNNDERQVYKRKLSKGITTQKRLRKKLGIAIPTHVDKVEV